MRFLLYTTTVLVIGLFIFISLVIYIYNLRIKLKDSWLKSGVFLTGWLVFLFIIYFIWIKFRSPYLIEFMPAVLLFASVAIYLIFEFWTKIKDRYISSLFKLSSMGVLILSIFTSFFWNLRFPFTGLHTPKEINEVSLYLKENTYPGEEVLTASVIFPFVSGNRLPFNISHPAWYGYPDIDKDSLLLFFPSFNDFSNYIKDKKTRFIITDPFTQGSYFKLHPDFYKYVESEYEQVKVVGRAKILKLK